MALKLVQLESQSNPVALFRLFTCTKEFRPVASTLKISVIYKPQKNSIGLPQDSLTSFTNLVNS